MAGSTTVTVQRTVRTVTVANQGATGAGVPTGGTLNQVLAKASGADYDTEWQNPAGGAGTWAGLGATDDPEASVDIGAGWNAVLAAASNSTTARDGFGLGTGDSVTFNALEVPTLTMGAATILQDVAGTTTLSNIDQLDATTTSTIDAAVSHFSPTDIDTDYGAETVTSDWIFQGAAGAGGLTNYDLSIGDVTTPDYGILRVGNSILGRTNNVVGYNLNGAFVVKNVGGPVTGDIEFAVLDNSDLVRFALPKSAAGNATYNPRSMLIVGPAVADSDVVTVGYWETQGVFSSTRIPCNTGVTGADLGVQNNVEIGGDAWVQGTFYADVIGEETAASGVTIDGVLIKDGLVDGIDVSVDVAANTTHRTSDGSDHSFLNQSVTSTATPTFAGLTINTTAGLTLGSGAAANQTLISVNDDDATASLIFDDTKESFEFNAPLYADTLMEVAYSGGTGTIGGTLQLKKTGTYVGSDTTGRITFMYGSDSVAGIQAIRGSTDEAATLVFHTQKTTAGGNIARLWITEDGDIQSQSPLTLRSSSGDDINILPDGTGNVWIGTLEFDADMTVGAGQDGYVLSYNNTSGHIELTDSTTLEVNDLTASVTWANVPDGNITSSSVVQHLAGTANEIVHSSGTFGIADNPTIPGTTGMIIPIKATTGDPTGSDGRIYYNSFDNLFRGYNNGAWETLAGGGGLTNWEENGTTLRPKVDGYDLGETALAINDIHLTGTGAIKTDSTAIDLEVAGSSKLYADSGGVKLFNQGELHIYSDLDNPATNYERLTFRVHTTGDGYIEMENGGTSDKGSLYLRATDAFEFVYLGGGTTNYLCIDDTRVNISQGSQLTWSSTGQAATTLGDLRLDRNGAGSLNILDGSDAPAEARLGQIFFTERADHIGTPVATEGRLWVRSDTPNVLVFTDDAGTDTVLGAGGGTPGGADTQIQYNNGGSSFGGVAELTYNNATGLLDYSPTLDEATGDEVALYINPTINKATSGAYRGIWLNATETAAPASDFSNYLLQLDVGLVNKMWVNAYGEGYFTGTVFIQDNDTQPVMSMRRTGTFAASDFAGQPTGKIGQMTGSSCPLFRSTRRSTVAN